MKRTFLYYVFIFVCCYFAKGQSIDELRRNADKGDLFAQYELGKLYLENRDTNNAIYWYKKAAEQELSAAQLSLAIIYYDQKDTIQEMKWMLRAAQNGSVSAQNLLGHYFKDKKDYENAFYWFKKSADQGDDDSQFYVGACYYLGHGVKEDKEKAEIWFKKSAKQGNAKAKQFYSDSHLKFKGIEINGPVNDFVLEMQKQGFYYYTRSGKFTIMKGNFAGYNDCFLYISTNTEGNVEFVAVNFKSCDDWQTLSVNYLNIKTMLRKKYGEPARYEEVFETTPQPFGDFEKMRAVKKGQCKYSTTFITPEGYITVIISNLNSGSYVSLLYSDDKNSNVDKKKAMEDL